MNTILPAITPQQQMVLAFHNVTLPEATVVKPGQVHVWAFRLGDDGRRIQWVEAIGRDINVATQTLVNEIARA